MRGQTYGEYLLLVVMLAVFVGAVALRWGSQIEASIALPTATTPNVVHQPAP